MSTNILLNKTATASGYVAPFSPDRAVNGNSADPKSAGFVDLTARLGYR